MMNHSHEKDSRYAKHRDDSEDMITEDMYDEIARRTRRKRIFIGVGILLVLGIAAGITVPLVLLSQQEDKPTPPPQREYNPF